MYPGVVDDIIISVKSDIDEYINAEEIVIEWYPKFMRVRSMPRNTEEYNKLIPGLISSIKNLREDSEPEEVGKILLELGCIDSSDTKL